MKNKKINNNIDISIDDKTLAKYLVQTLKEEVSIDEYWDENEVNSIDIMTAENAPSDGVTTAVTLGLSNISTGFEVDGQVLRVEILMPYASDELDGPNIIATVTLNVINNQMDAEPGVVHLNAIEMYIPGSDMKHILLTHPFTWELQSQKLTHKTVAWLQAVPISQNEYEFALEHGVDQLEDLLEAKSVDVFDLRRVSCIK
jgi:antitoxin YqcF